MKKIVPISIIIILLIAVVYAVMIDLKEAKNMNVEEEDVIGKNNEDDNFSKNKISKVNLVSYTNDYYKFSLNFPKGLGYCLSGFCIEQNVPDEDISYFEVTTYDFLKYKGIEVTPDTMTYPLLQIYPRKYSSDVSVIDLAKRSLDLNRKYSKNSKDVYRDEQEITFAGELAYSFIADGSFEERGVAYNDSGNLITKDNESPFITKASEGRLLGTPHKVIYLNHNGFIYRIIYPIENKIAESIVNSFKFIN